MIPDTPARNAVHQILLDDEGQSNWFP